MDKKITIGLVIFFILLFINNTLLAFNVTTSSLNINFKSDEDKNIKCTLYFDKPIYGGVFKVEYDSELFEFLTNDSIYGNTSPVNYMYDNNYIINGVIYKSLDNSNITKFEFYFVPQKSIKNAQIKIIVEKVSTDNVNYEDINILKIFSINNNVIAGNENNVILNNNNISTENSTNNNYIAKTWEQIGIIALLVIIALTMVCMIIYSKKTNNHSKF
ncbi:MAG: hypothetical protein FWF46_05200 [Oscillospiraceae bacterium]|nr:hypothetical protein [Oscillospiraceae bacterium]